MKTRKRKKDNRTGRTRIAIKVLTPAQSRVLRLLAIQPRGVLLRPGGIGDRVWGDQSKKSACNCSAPFARQAGKVLNSLRAMGFVEYVHDGDDWGWRATPKGRAAA